MRFAKNNIQVVFQIIMKSPLQKILFVCWVITLPNYFFGQSQRQQIELHWSSNPLKVDEDNVIKVPNFNPDLFFYDDQSKSIFAHIKVKTNGVANPQSLQISNQIWESINTSELGELDKSRITENAPFKIEVSKGRSQWFATIHISPLRIQNGQYQKLTSFTYNFQLQTTQTFDNQTLDYTGIQNSALAQGQWFRFYVEKSGVYRLNRSFLQQLGLNMNQVDPKNIQIYGHGGRMAPLLNATPYAADLVQNAIYVEGENDGVFDANDFILFYAEGTDTWNAESLTHVNLYDNRSYYYITVGNSNGKRIQPASDPIGPTTATFQNYDGYHFHEIDEINVGRLGRRWFGEQFGIQNTRNFNFTIPRIVPNSNVQLTIAAGAASFNSSSLTVSTNQTNLGTMLFPAIGTGSTSPSFSEANFSSNFIGSPTIAIQLTYNNNGLPNARGFLDYIILRTTERLIGNGQQYTFRVQNQGQGMGVAAFQFVDAQNIRWVWDITDLYNVTSFANNNQSNFAFRSPMGAVREFVVVDSNDFLTPQVESNPRVVNQNLKGTIFNNASGTFQDIDYLIVTTPALRFEAERLAQFHRNFSQLNTKVVTTDLIYHEFSSGKQDVAAIRNFVKYIYQNASSDDKRLKYINLFGHASFDYKDRVPNNTNVVPVYQALLSNSKLSSVMSDDFYGMMDPNEGRLAHNVTASLDIAVGRMLVKQPSDAREMVNKVLEYHDKESFGRWRNNFLLLSDDVDEVFDSSIQTALDQLSVALVNQKPFVNVTKIHLDSYVQETTSGGQRYPQAKEDLLTNLNSGALVFNYFGHGNEDGLASERMFERVDAENLQNRHRYPLFITVTCEFSRFDNPFRKSAGEATYTNPRGGAISMVTTTRLITVSGGIAINNFFASYLYGYNSNEPITIAEALRLAKNDFNSTSYMVFYLGDPALRLAIPQLNIKLTKINDVPIAESTTALQALSFVKLSGEITDINNQILSNYTGQVGVQIFDKNIQRTTLGNDGTIVGGQLAIMNFQTLGETIFRGNASVTNGLFDIQFVVPRNIRIPLGNGKVSFYATRNQPVLDDHTGANLDIQVGGINDQAPVDVTPPRMRLYMNDESFVNGGITNTNPIFLAFLEDESGINTAGGIGHDLVGILDNDENNPIVMNDFYETNVDDFTKGTVRFPFRNLSPGMHTLRFKAWDVYNNPSEAEIQFQVIGNESISLTNVLNYPNPFVSHTEFWFTHNRPFEPLDVHIQILTVSGKLVKTIRDTVQTDGFLSRSITWDGRDDFGERIGKGVYVYKLTVRSTLTNQKAEKYEKLVIL